MTAPKVIGLDLSLTCTGVAGRGWTDTIEPVKRGAAFRDRRDKIRDAQLRTAYNHERLSAIREQLRTYTNRADLVVMEGMAFDANDYDRQLAGLAWITRHCLWTWSIPYALVPPSTLKQFVTGTGAADKALMRDLIADWFPWFDGGHDEADAAGLMAMGYAHLGMPLGPLLDHQVTALGKSAWPEMPAAVHATHPDPADPGYCGHELHGADGGACPGCGWDSHPIPTEPTPPTGLDGFPDVALVSGQAVHPADTRTNNQTAEVESCPSQYASTTGAVIACRQVGLHTIHSNLADVDALVTWVSGDDNELTRTEIAS